VIPCIVDDLKAELAADEGYRQKRYLCSAGKLTIGIGHNLEGKKFSPETWAMIRLEHPHVDNALLDDQVRLSDEIIQRIFTEDCEDACEDLDGIWIGWRSLSERRKRALINMSFQMGSQRLTAFVRMWRALRLHDFEAAADEAKDSLWYVQTQASRTGRVLAQIREG